ncbi:MAG: Crp/Fnr family transcriptional regulator [Acidiferrobacterales bacterium]
MELAKQYLERAIRKDTPALLAKHYLFRDLDETVVDRIAALAVTRRAKAGEVLFLKGDEGDTLYSVVSGQVRISTSGPGGRTVILNVMGPGDVFGEIALLDGMPRTADAIVIVPTELITIARRGFIALLEREPSLTIHLLKLICERLRRTSEQVEDSVLLPVPGRLAKRLLSMADVDGEVVSNGVRVRLQPSQSELGQMLGISRVCINKHLQRWRKRGWISLTRGHVIICNREALRGLIDESCDEWTHRVHGTPHPVQIG